MSGSGSEDEQPSPSTPVAVRRECNRSDFGCHESEPLADEDSDELNEKRRLIREILEMQATLEALSGRVDSVREENLRLRSENQVLGQYIENLMQASQVFQAIPPSKAASGVVPGRPTLPQSTSSSSTSSSARTGPARPNSGSRGSRQSAQGQQNGTK